MLIYAFKRLFKVCQVIVFIFTILVFHGKYPANTWEHTDNSLTLARTKEFIELLGKIAFKNVMK